MPDYQSAYRPNHSCESAMVKLVNDSLWNMEHQKLTMIVATDLSAAFDTVDYDITLEVLQKRYGIDGTALSWFYSYLRPRLCTVAINNSFSNTRELFQSVPQGSSLGPVVYSSYAITLQTGIPITVSIHRYADNHIFKCSYPCVYSWIRWWSYLQVFLPLCLFMDTLMIISSSVPTPVSIHGYADDHIFKCSYPCVYSWIRWWSYLQVFLPLCLFMDTLIIISSSVPFIHIIRISWVRSAVFQSS